MYTPEKFTSLTENIFVKITILISGDFNPNGMIPQLLTSVLRSSKLE